MTGLTEKRKHIYLSLCLVVVLAGVGLWMVTSLSSDASLVTIKIGFLLPLNSDLMATAVKMKNGAEMAKEDLVTRHKGALSIEMYHVNACSESETAPAVQKFIHDGVSIIAAAFCLFGYVPILPLTESNKILTFNTSENPDVVLYKRFAFSVNVEIKDQARAMADFVFATLGARRVVIMYIDSPFGHDYNKYFAREFARLGGTLLFGVPNAPNGKIFKEIVDKIKAARPDAIVTAHFGVPLGVFIREVREAGIEAPIVGNYETEDSDVVKAAGEAAEGVIFVSSEASVRTEAMTAFAQRYVRRFGVEPDVLVTNSYDSVVLAVEASLKCHGERECMSNKLHQVEGYQGVSGVITIKASGATGKPAVFKIIRNRAFIPYRRPDSSP